MPKKLTYSYVKEQIEKTGYKLLSKEYKDAHTKLGIQCLEGHMYKVRWSEFQQGAKCPTCNTNRKRHDYDYVKTFIESKGYKLLSKEYINARIKLKIRCPKKHIYKVEWNNFHQGTKCPICASETRGNIRRHTYGYVKKFIESKKYELLSKEYKGAHAKLKFQCPERHKFEMAWTNFQRGKRCPICYNNKRWYTYDYVKEQIERKGYKLLSEDYKGTRAKLKLQCIENHIFEITWSHILRNQGCPICWANSTTSKAENEIAEMVEAQGIKIKRNDRTQIINPLTSKKLELDIWMPELNRAVEFNGMYWHSFKYQKIKDKIKIKQCIEKGIELLIINEKDWINNKACCINEIKNFVKSKIIPSYSETT